MPLYCSPDPATCNWKRVFTTSSGYITRISVTPAIAPAANWYWNGSATVSCYLQLDIRLTSGADIVEDGDDGMKNSSLNVGVQIFAGKFGRSRGAHRPVHRNHKYTIRN